MFAHLLVLGVVTVLTESSKEKQFRVPARITDFFPEPYDPFTSTKATAREDLQAEFRHSQSLFVQPLSALGLELIPGPVLDFGTQPLGTEVCATLRLVNHKRYPVVIEILYAQHPLTVAETEGAEVPLAVSSRQSVAIEVCLQPLDFGDFASLIYVKTSLGYTSQAVTAQIVEGEYLIRPVRLFSNQILQLSLFNPHSSPMSIQEIKASNKALEVYTERELTLEPKETRVIAGLQAWGMIADGVVTLHIVSNFAVLVVPVHYRRREYWLSLSRPLIDFGIVSIANVAHVQEIFVSNSGFRPMNITKIVSDSETVSINQLQTTVENSLNAALVADAVFYPKAEGVFMGEITIEVEQQITMKVAYRGFAQFDLVKYRFSDLVFSPIESEPRPFFLNFNFPSPVKVVSVFSPCEAFTIKPTVAQDSLGAGSEGNRYTIEVKRTAIRKNSFIAIETDIGLMALPLIVDEGSFQCTVLETGENCRFPHVLHMGNIPVGESRMFRVFILNTSYFPLHIFANCVSPFETVSLYTNTDATTLVPMSNSDCHASRLHLVGPNLSVTVVGEFTVAEASPQSLATEIHISHKVLHLDLVWNKLKGDLVVTPQSIVLEQVFIGRTHTISVVMEHNFQSPIVLEQATTNIDGLEFIKHQEFVVPKVPVRTWDIRYPVLPETLFSITAADFRQNVEVAELRQHLLWTSLNQEKVEGTIIFHTDTIFDVNIPFSAVFQVPSLAQKKLEFGFVRQMDTRPKYIRVQNPADYPVQVQLLLCGCALNATSEIAGQISHESALIPPSSHLRVIRHPDVPRSFRQSFFLSEKSRKPVVIRPKQSAVLGPVLFHAASAGLSTTNLYIRNNLTGFHTVELLAHASHGAFEVVLETERRRHVLTYREVSMHKISIDVSRELQFVPRTGAFCRSYALKNTGNEPLFVMDVALEGRLCELREFKLRPCHNTLLLYPGNHFEVSLFIRPSFAETNSTVDLWIRTPEEVFIVAVELHVPETDYSEAVRAANSWRLEYIAQVVISMSLGILFSFLYELLSSQKSIVRHILEKPVAVVESLRPLTLPAKKKPKKHAKTSSVPQVVEQPPSNPAPEVSFPEPVVLEPVLTEPIFSEAVEVPEEEQNGSEEDQDDEDFLDEYRSTSCLFWGFNPDIEH